MSTAMRKTCAQCGAENPPAANFCRQCGRPWGLPWVRAAVSPAPIAQQWRRLKLRMTRKEVRTLLGEPAQIVAAPADAPECERWQYYYERGATPQRLVGQVQISVAEGCVVAWNEPDWSGAPIS